MEKTPIDHIEKQLIDYLLMQTNYAIMLTASWGAGKTYYLKNNFFNKAKEFDYQGISVSLFGINSIDDIKDRIFLALFPSLGNKYLKASGTILKLILKSVDISTFWSKGYMEGFDEAKADFDKQKFDFIKLEKLLICFDDLERVSPTMLKGNQILGYINSLVEDNNIKVIIVANEDKIDLGEIKEKTIGNTIHFSQEYAQAFQNIVTTLQNPTGSYITHLKANKELIYDFLIRENSKNINYRTLTYFLAKYDKICHYIQSGFKSKDLNEKKEEILTNILKYCLMICVEFKKGLISFRDKKKIDRPELLVLNMLKKSKGDVGPKEYAEQTIELYFPANDYNFYESIYNYLTGGDYFNADKFYEELCSQYNISNGHISEAYQVYQQLSYQKINKLTDSEYIKLTKQLRSFALSGEYNLLDYITIFYYVMRHGNVLNLNAQRLTNDLIKAMKKVQTRHQYISSLYQYFKPSPEGEFYNYSIQIFNAIDFINNNALIREQRKYDENVETEFKANFQGLYNKMIGDMKKPFTRITLSGMRPMTFYRVFAQADNLKKADIVMLFRIVYNVQSGNYTTSDYKFLTNLEIILKAKTPKVNKNVSGNLFCELLAEVSKKIDERQRYI